MVFERFSLTGCYPACYGGLLTLHQVFKNRGWHPSFLRAIIRYVTCTTKTGIMQLSITPPKLPETEANSGASENFYWQLKDRSSSIISLQYNPNDFLSFKVYEATCGVIVRQGFKNVALQCQIRGTTYTFTDEHLDQMSKREINDLCNHLGVQRR